MDNWLVAARKAAGASEGDLAEALGLDLDAYGFIELHPGRLTLNQVGALSRVMGEEHAKSMLARIAEIYV